jgi:hypothetical protein
VPNARSTARAVVALLGVLVAAAGCGDNEAGPPATVRSPAAATATAAAQSTMPPPTRQTVDKELVYTIVKRKATPPTGRVDVAKGAVVKITVTSDEADELHVHGYDVELPLKAGTAGSITIEATKTGLFEVETHKSHLVLLQLAVR